MIEGGTQRGGERDGQVRDDRVRDEAGYESTAAEVRDAAHAHDARLAGRG